MSPVASTSSGASVMLDSGLAELYQVPAKEASALRSQIVTLETGRGHYSKIRSPGLYRARSDHARVDTA